MLPDFLEQQEPMSNRSRSTQENAPAAQNFITLSCPIALTIARGLDLVLCARQVADSEQWLVYGPEILLQFWGKQVAAHY